MIDESLGSVDWIYAGDWPAAPAVEAKSTRRGGVAYDANGFVKAASV